MPEFEASLSSPVTEQAGLESLLVGSFLAVPARAVMLPEDCFSPNLRVTS